MRYLVLAGLLLVAVLVVLDASLMLIAHELGGP